MKARYDAVLISSVLLTIAFALLIPPSWSNAQAGHNQEALASMGPELASYAILLGQSGFASMAIVLVTLILVWKGYVRRLQWVWLVMFIIVWAWYFPLFVLPTLRFLRGFDSILWLSSLKHLGLQSYTPPVWFLIFLLMLLALFLPAREFFPRKAQDKAAE